MNYKSIYLFTLFTISIFGCVTLEQDKQNHKVNIIYILADDLGYGDLSLTGQTKFKTPNIDQLAKDGMFLNQHYSGSTVCAPSRSALMTGQHTGHTPIRGNKELKPEGQHPMPDETITVAELLQQNGYVTGAFGKWGLGYPGSEGDPNHQGFDVFYGYNCQRIGHNYYPYHLWHNQKKVMLEGNAGSQTESYAPNLIHEQVLSFLEKNRDTSFFMFYPSIIPHAELVVPDYLMKKYSGRFSPETAYKGSEPNDTLWYKNGGYGSQKEPRAAFAAMIELLDNQVGEIRKKIEELGIADKTIIIFSSDNGAHKEGGADPEYFNSNGNFRGYKRDFYDGGIRVPTIITWEGKIAPNSQSNHLSAFWDFLPTVCDIAEIEKPNKIDGISFLPTLLGQEQKAHDFLYWEFYGYQPGDNKQAVRMGAWKGIRTRVNEIPIPPMELYDLFKDSLERHNVADQFPEITEKIATIMEREHTYSSLFHFEYEEKEE